jgi:hypothetical protein
MLDFVWSGFNNSSHRNNNTPFTNPDTVLNLSYLYKKTSIGNSFIGNISLK